jgi:pyruvate formate lyase activating enzyme
MVSAAQLRDSSPGHEEQLPVGLILNIMRFAVHDGPGIRTTVFLKGCPLRCCWCHNPESQLDTPEVIYMEERCIRCGECVAGCPHGALRLNGSVARDASACQRCGKCAETCASEARQFIGRRMTVSQVLETVLKDSVFFEQSGGGVTVSGGEPLMQADFVRALLEACRGGRIHTVLDTCGYAETAVLRDLCDSVDLFLYDLKIMDEEKHRRFTGVGNELILHNLKFLAERGRRVIVRIPVIPGVNDDTQNFDSVAEFLSPLGLREVELLPFHRIGHSKYERLHKRDGMEHVEPPTREQMESIAARLNGRGLHAHIGG